MLTEKLIILLTIITSAKDTMIKLSYISKSHLDAHRENYNSANHWIDNIKPDNYDEYLKSTWTRTWIDKFHTSYTVINIRPCDTVWMKDAYTIGNITGRFPKSYKAALMDALSSYPDIDQCNYFVRAENVSLKTGCKGIGPYKRTKDILRSLVTCRSNHTPVREDVDTIKLYLLPWQNINEKYEFRVFVNDKRVVAISQQNWFTVYDYEPDELIAIASKIMEYYENKIKLAINLDNYTIDMAILDSGEPYFIEVNCFGREYAAGSALFHWLLDDAVLYPKSYDSVEFRYLVAE